MRVSLLYIYLHSEPAARNAAAARRPLNSSRVVAVVSGECI